MGYYWLKVYTEILHDPKVMRLPPIIRLRFYECLVLAREYDQDGDLPPDEDAAFIFRIPEEQYQVEMKELQSAGLVDRNGCWHLPKFTERQSAIVGAERVKKYREIKRREEYEQEQTGQLCNENQKECNETLQECNESLHRIEQNRIDKNRVEEEQITPASAISQTGSMSYARIWADVTGMVAIPGSEVSKVLPALDALKVKYTVESDLISYLKRYYTDWVKRRGKNGANYSRTNCAWLYDLAVAEETLVGEKRDAVKAANREILEMGRPDHECKVCGGNGVYNKDGRFIKCGCTKKERK